MRTLLLILVVAFAGFLAVRALWDDPSVPSMDQTRDAFETAGKGEYNVIDGMKSGRER